MKRLISPVFLLIAAYLLPGCQTAPSKEGTAPSGAAPAKEVTLPIVRKPDHSIVHPASGMRFPEQVGDFKRTGVKQSGPRGLNVSSDYRFAAEGTEVLVTVSVYPAPSVTAAGTTEGLIREARPGMADSEYQSEVKRILNSHPQTEVTTEKETILAQDAQKHIGHYVEFEYEDTMAGRRQPVTSRLYLFNDADEKWAVKFRVTYPRGFPAETLVNAFLTELHWTLKGG
jgi:hypothetical protein